MNNVTNFVIIDDDAINNKICKAVLSKLLDDVSIITFLDPIKGYAHIVTEYSRTDHDEKCVLLLDLNMPVMNGWQFLELFDKQEDALKGRVKIFILSSSVDKRDIERADKDKNVTNYLIKPLTKETIKLITFALNKQ